MIELKHLFHVTKIVNVGEINNIVMQYCLPKQSKADHPKIQIFMSGLSARIHYGKSPIILLASPAPAWHISRNCETILDNVWMAIYVML